jgi:hypothetical protein
LTTRGGKGMMSRSPGGLIRIRPTIGWKGENK